MMNFRVRRVMKVVGWCLGASAVACLVSSLAVYIHVRQFVETAARANGKIIKLVENRSSDSGMTYRPVFVFRDSDGRDHEIYSSVGSCPPAYKVGEEVTVLYNKGDPENASLAGFFDLWLMPLVLGCIGAVHLLIAFVLLIVIPAIWKPKPPTELRPVQVFR
jgi:hypothetical protein